MKKPITFTFREIPPGKRIGTDAEWARLGRLSEKIATGRGTPADLKKAKALEKKLKPQLLPYTGPPLPLVTPEALARIDSIIAKLTKKINRRSRAKR